MSATFKAPIVLFWGVSHTPQQAKGSCKSCLSGLGRFRLPATFCLSGEGAGAQVGCVRRSTFSHRGMDDGCCKVYVKVLLSHAQTWSQWRKAGQADHLRDKET